VRKVTKISQERTKTVRGKERNLKKKVRKTVKRVLKETAFTTEVKISQFSWGLSIS
jgi:hypothetical protein